MISTAGLHKKTRYARAAPEKTCRRRHSVSTRSSTTSLPPGDRDRPVERWFTVRPSIEDLIEAAGVPHTEVDLLLVDGESVDFAHRVRDGDRISVYPVFESIDIAAATKFGRSHSVSCGSSWTCIWDGWPRISDWPDSIRSIGTTWTMRSWPTAGHTGGGARTLLPSCSSSASSPLPPRSAPAPTPLPVQSPAPSPHRQA